VAGWIASTAGTGNSKTWSAFGSGFFSAVTTGGGIDGKSAGVETAGTGGGSGVVGTAGVAGALVGG
jgi:hypothetical protein